MMKMFDVRNMENYCSLLVPKITENFMKKNSRFLLLLSLNTATAKRLVKDSIPLPRSKPKEAY